MYLSGSAFLANLAPPNRQYFEVKLGFKSLDHVSNLKRIEDLLYLEK